MNSTFKVARVGLNRCWRFVSQKARGEVSGVKRLPVASGQKRRYAERYTFDDKTQAQIEGLRREAGEAPQESPWRDSEWSADFPERLNELGYESHCNDRLYIAKNKHRDAREKYIMEREERRLEARERFDSHFAQSSMEPEAMRRRTISQDPVDHQKRQAAIIEQNRRKWQSRPESRRETNTSGITYRPDRQKQKKLEEYLQSEAEDFQHLKRKMERPVETDSQTDSQTTVFDPNRPTAEWLKKREEEAEAQYWHSWHTCPGSRDNETTEEVKHHLKRKRVVPIPPAYPRDSQRRGYHQIVPPAYQSKGKAVVVISRRRPSGIERQFHKFATKQATPWHPDFPETLANAQPLPQPKVVPKKQKKQKKPERKEERRSVEPPRFRMVVKTRTPVPRPSTPVCSYSGHLEIPPEIAGPSVYMGALNAWRNFSTAKSK
ncbi:uncharacterized protein LOC108090477 [Drosophila ficusphila]|uniref:uncharacterized protein LOC108090477 n=1 Tax=Drosophila ficusphila TaxID=30025 RepID=UPI0007E73573|nr:uncharacterized protein LOC108090477 [Drosophila ficusphila]